MFGKIKDMLSSIRFWFMVVAALLGILVEYGIIPSEIATPIIAWLIGSVGVRTLDKFTIVK